MYLDVVRDHPNQQTADIISKFDAVLERETPDLVLVVGDVTSTDSCALAASKRDVPLAHVEAGLRSRDRRMPEERTRLVTDDLPTCSLPTQTTPTPTSTLKTCQVNVFFKWATS